jgi:hypothetical protein
MIRYMDGLPQSIASTSALCTADMPFLVQLLHIMKRGDDNMLLFLILYMHSCMFTCVVVLSATARPETQDNEERETCVQRIWSPCSEPASYKL